VLVQGNVGLARTADTLTLARLGFALLLTAVVGRSLTWAGLLLAAAWISDALDGRAARASNRLTRLGRLDLSVDTAVGAGLLLGMAAGGILSFPFAVGLTVVLGGAYLWLRNPAPALALQGVAYGWFLAVVWTQELAVRWVLLATIAVLCLTGARRLFTVVIPAFLAGTAALIALRRGSDHGLR
jgi:phosphatidylglycerophosphate synthase